MAYIDKDLIRDEILSNAVRLNHPKDLCTETTLYLIDVAPVADVVEVKHGEWITKEYHPLGHEYICSVCGFVVPRKYKHCPECISRMDGGNENDV